METENSELTRAQGMSILKAATVIAIILAAPALAVAQPYYGSQPYQSQPLEQRDFALCLQLLWAEGQFLTVEDIIESLEIPNTRSGVARVIRRLMRKFAVNGLDDPLERSPGTCRLKLYPPSCA